MEPASANHFFATCSKGVEDLLQNELERLNVPEIKLEKGGVSFTGDITHAYSACLWSRVANRILLQLKTFEIGSDDDLYNQIIAVDWSVHLSAHNTLAIDCFTSHARVTNSHYATLRIKDAIVDQFMQQTGQRPSISKDVPDIRINVYLSDQQCIAYLDLSGQALHKRGYRNRTGEAPLRETLAAAMLYRARWQTFYQQGLPFFDPMCGSGTLLIEAAMMAADIAPGLLRDSFGFAHWKQFKQQQWQAIRDDADDRKQAGLSTLPVICGSDSNERVLGLCTENIRSAGLASYIKVSMQDATNKLKPCTGIANDKAGLIVTNPPYGKRIGQLQQLRTLYYRFGAQLKAGFDGWTVAVITSEADLAKSIGLRAFRKNTLFNGPLRSVLYQYHINSKPEQYADETKQGQKEGNRQAAETAIIATNRASEHASMFTNRLRKNYKHLKKWARKNDISCYRVYDADIPQYAVAIDKYGDWVVVQEYKPPGTVDKNRAFQRINDVIDVVADILETTQQCVVLKVRKKQQGDSQYQKYDQKQQTITVTENGLKFLVNLYDYIDTGLFLDHRNTRQLIKQLAGGRSFLNLFAYTGSVTVYAAAGGASATTTVDMSNTYLKWAQNNLLINGYYSNSRSQNRHRFVREDCLLWLKQAVSEKQKYQLIFIDPPTFSNSKKMTNSMDIRRDHAAILADCVSLLTSDGQLIFSTNARNFKLDSSVNEMCYVKEITATTTTEDFRRKPQHRCWVLAKQQALLDIHPK